MHLLASAIEAQLHRETYVALLNSLLRVPGSKHALAQQAKISAPYLSYLLKLDRDQSDASIAHTPSMKVAERIVASLDTSPDIQASLLEHLTLAHEKRLRAAQVAHQELFDRPLSEVAQEIQAIRSQAMYATTATSANHSYLAAVNAAKLALRAAPAETSPLEYVDLCDFVTDCQLVLNRADDALWHAKLALAVLDCYDPLPAERERYAFLVMNMLRQQGVAYFNLGQYRESLRVYTQVEALKPVGQLGGIVKSLLLHDKVKALAQMPRFSITEVENIADDNRNIIERVGAADGPLHLWLLTEALADAYIRHANYKDARRVLDQEAARLSEIRAMGPLHHVLFLRRYATLSRHTQDLTGWHHFIGEARQIAREAGLSHQLVGIEAEVLSVDSSGMQVDI